MLRRSGGNVGSLVGCFPADRAPKRECRFGRSLSLRRSCLGWHVRKDCNRIFIKGGHHCSRNLVFVRTVGNQGSPDHQKNLGIHKFFMMLFLGKLSLQPISTQLIRNFQCMANILVANTNALISRPRTVIRNELSAHTLKQSCKSGTSM